jgi:hypothetical protein
VTTTGKLSYSPPVAVLACHHFRAGRAFRERFRMDQLPSRIRQVSLPRRVGTGIDVNPTGPDLGLRHRRMPADNDFADPPRD